MIFIGIDPGVGGGLAAITEDGLVLEAVKMPSTEADVLAWLRKATTPEDNVAGLVDWSRAALEKVASSPQMGVVSAFTFGKGYGALRMALTAACIPFDEVAPAKWQKAMQCRTGGDKNISKRRAQELFPALTVTHAIADALLLAEFARRIERGR